MHWLVVVGERDALEWIFDNGRTAFRDHVRADAVRLGDPFAIYVTRGAFHNPARDEAQIAALGQFTTDLEDAPVTIADETFGRSVGTGFDTVLPPRNGMPFKPLVNSLDFIAKKESWSVYLRRSLVPLKPKDYNRIARAFRAYVGQQVNPRT